MKLTQHPDIEVRDVEPRDFEQVVQLLQRERAHLGGSRRAPVFRALLRDTQGPHPHTAVAIAARDGQPIAVIVAIAGNSPKYWKSLALRHPSAFLALTAHRLKKTPARMLRRKRYQAMETGGEGAHAALDPRLADEPRLQVPLPGPDDPGPHWGETGPKIARGLYLVVDRSARGMGVSEPVFRRVLFHLRELGLDRYDCSFDPSSGAAIRMHLSMPFTVYRMSTGYVATIDLHDPALDWPPPA